MNFTMLNSKVFSYESLFCQPAGESEWRTHYILGCCFILCCFNALNSFEWHLLIDLARRVLQSFFSRGQLAQKVTPMNSCIIDTDFSDYKRGRGRV